MGKNTNLKSNKGFSLMELLVVIAIMAIAMSMSVGGVFMIRKAQVRGATKDIGTQITRARGYALSHDQEVRLSISPEGGKTLMARIQYNTDSGFKDKFSQAVGKDIKISFVDSNGTYVEFTSDTNGHLYVYYDKRSGRISKITADIGMGEQEISTSASTNGTIHVELAKGGTDKVGLVKIYYENGAVE